MKIAELFVQLGVQGTDKAVKALSEVKVSITDLASSALATGAAITGAVYALQRLSAGSAATGTSLVNFAALTHGSIVELQKWEYGMRQAGMTGDETKQGLQGLLKAMGDMAAGKGAPEGFARIASTVGVDTKRIGDTIYMMSKFRDYAKKTASLTGTDLAIANSALESVGFGAFTAAARRGKLDESVLAHAPVYSTGQAQKLAQINGAWLNLGKSIEIAVGKLNAKHGLELVKDVTLLTVEIFKLINALVSLGEKIHIFEGLGAAVKVAAAGINIFSSLATNPKEAFPFTQTPVIHPKNVIPFTRSVPYKAHTQNTTHNSNLTVNNHGVPGAKEGANHFQKALNNVLGQVNTKTQTH